MHDLSKEKAKAIMFNLTLKIHKVITYLELFIKDTSPT